MSEFLLEVQSLSKSYGNLKVLDDITFALKRGEIVGLVGRRGAGKSSLLHLLGGASQATSGKIILQGQSVRFSSYRQARQNGVELVFQVPHLVEQFDIVQNIFLGREICWPPKLGVPFVTRMYQRSKEILGVFDLPSSFLQEKTANLNDEQRQLVALARALSHNPRLLLVDDVLPNLSFHHQEALLAYIQKRAQDGVGVIISSDNLQHLFNITDRILVLYESRLSADQRTIASTPRDIVERIVGASNREQVTPIIWALENYHAARKQTEELFKKQTVLHENLEASDTLNRQLIEKLSKQVKALDRLNEALQETQRRLLTEREEERKALARELHDLVIQDLLSVNYRLEETESDQISADQRTELGAIRDGIRQVVGDLRQLCRDLRPPTIDNHGLSSAIQSHAQEWAERLDIAIQVEIAPSLGRLPETTEISIFRIIQEGLYNIGKHATARNVSMSLQRTTGDDLLIRIVDDGQGFDIPPNLADLSTKQHFGLIGISERAALLGGKMKLESPPEGGFVLQVEIPSSYPYQ
ncbi:MAG: ATP-binding cassette domain-containing protein [Anaerolineae bacterium]|nr:ATP-binding cassette domain-containing protein [Anaerolineae bacterium]